MTLKTDLEAAVAVEPETADERIGIFFEYSAGARGQDGQGANGQGVAECGPALVAQVREGLGCDILMERTYLYPGVPMNGLPLRESQIFGMLAFVGAGLGGVAVYALLRRRESPDELERQRRDLLVQQGRIIDATVIDISDLTAEESGRPNGMQLILYRYEAAGVVYECSQDVTMLRNLVNIYDCRLGFPASVRYDPHNPGNSLIVAESWSGLRDTANSVPLHGSPERRSGATSLR
ncbi:MAG: DUF3592 domain-containing protein [Acidobacteriaceae bacterium]